MTLSTAFGQTGTGTIDGVICDTSWTSIRGATVEAKDAQLSYTAVSLGNGSYSIAGLPPGRYTITVTLPGMRTYAHAYVSVQAGAMIEENVQLEIDSRPDSSDPGAPFSLFALRGRDLYDQDGEFSLASPVLLLNDNGFGLPSDLTMVKGKIVWIYVPGHGRYWLSLAPRTELGFSLRGEVRETTLRFLDGSDIIRVDSADRIAPGSAVYNLYVRSQPDWSPQRESDRSMALLGSAKREDLPKSLLGR